MQRRPLNENENNNNPSNENKYQNAPKKYMNITRFNYTPVLGTKSPKEFNVYYSNISGNKIINEKYYKILQNI